MAARHSPGGSELYSLLGAPLVTQCSVRQCSAAPPRYSTTFLIARCSPGCLMLPYISVLVDSLPVARISTLLMNWYTPSSLSFSCLLTILPADRCPNDDFALSHC